MSISYTWKITTVKILNRGNLSDIIAQVYWSKQGVNGLGKSGTFNGSTSFDLNGIDINSFIDYSSISESTIIDWIKSDIDSKTGFGDHIDSVISAQIEANATTSIPYVTWQAPST